MMKSYPLFKVHVDSAEALQQIARVFKSGFINEGAEVNKLTERLGSYLGSEQLLLLNSCTSALTLALKLAGVSEGSDVVTTSMTCVATNTPIVTSGANIVWADVDPNTGMLTPESIESALTARTRAVIVVAWAGAPPDLERIQQLCSKNNVSLILDAAHAFGASYKDLPIHAWADYTCYSFQAIKHFTTGDGGAMVCRDAYKYQRAKGLKWFGLDRDRAKDEKGNWKGQQWDVDIEEAGFKFNMNNVAAAIGLSQFPRLDLTLALHRCNAMLYDELFDGFDYARPVDVVDGAESSHWVYAMRCTDSSRLSRDQLLSALNEEGIMAGVVHVPNDEYTCFKQFKKDLPGVRTFSSRQFALPCGWWMDDDGIRHIARRVKELTR